MSMYGHIVFYYIPSAWASALLILYQGQCESLMSGISKESRFPRSFYMLPPSQLMSPSSGNHAGKKLRPTRIRVIDMCKISQKEKKFVPVDFGAMIAWLATKDQPISIENLGGRGSHRYTANSSVISIDGGRGIITEDMWQEVCRDMVTRIPKHRLNMAVEYSHYTHFVQTPSIPVLCWAFCEEFLYGNQVWNI